MKCDNLFTTLHAQYNTYPAPLQDFEGFHYDVCEVSRQLSLTEDFYRRLEARKTQRIQEMINSWNKVTPFIAPSWRGVDDVRKASGFRGWSGQWPHRGLVDAKIKLK